MAATPTLVREEKSTTGGTGDYTTASVTLDPGFLYILDVVVVRAGGVPPSLTVTSTGATWDSLQSNAFNTIAATRTRRQSFRTAVSSQQIGGVTIAFSTDYVSIAVALTKWDGTVPPGTNGADAVQQIKGGRVDAATSISMTFDAAASAGNALHMHWASDGASGDTVTMDQSQSVLSDQSEVNDPLRAVTAYLTSAVTTFSVSGTSRDMAMLGVEIKALQGGNFGGPTRGLLRGVGRGMVR